MPFGFGKSKTKNSVVAKAEAPSGADEEAAREKAATKIQAQQRGKAGRQKAACKKAEISASKEEPKKEEEKQEEKPTEKQGETEVSQEKQQEAAACKIQARHRGNCARKEVCTKKKPAMEESKEDALERKIKAAHTKELSYDEAVEMARKGQTSFSVLAALSKRKDEMMAKMCEEQLDELMGGLKTKKEDDRPGVSEKRELTRKVFLQFCRDRRGSGLRAWRLDIDLRGTNRVSYTEFTKCIRHMGLSLDESMLVWQAYRPPFLENGDRAPMYPLSFHEFDPAEWSNMNGFLEILWKDFNFDIDLVWSYFDKDGSGSVEVDEWETGCEVLGFKGHAQRIFYGLDTSACGSVWKETMHYLFMLQPESHIKPEDSPLIKELKTWIYATLGKSGIFCDKLGLTHSGASISIHSAARHMDHMGYQGNCLHTAIALSRCNQFLNRPDAMEILGDEHKEPTAKRDSHSYAGRCMLVQCHENDIIALTDEKREWNNSTYDPCPFNQVLGKRERHVFSFPWPRPVREEVLSKLKVVDKKSKKAALSMAWKDTSGNKVSRPGR